MGEDCLLTELDQHHVPFALSLGITMASFWFTQLSLRLLQFWLGQRMKARQRNRPKQ